MISVSLALVIGSAPAVKQVSGTLFNAFLTTDGSVYGVGYDMDGMQVRPNWEKAYVLRPTKMTLPSGIKQIAIGHYTCFALLGNGTIISWGRATDGQLGDGAPYDQGHRMTTTPVQVNGLTDVVQIDACGDHAVALTAEGKVYAWGPGVPPFGNASTPRLMEGLSDVKHVDTGLRHTLALTKDGNVYAWGHNNTGQLGIGVFGNLVDKPTQVIGLPKAINISAGDGEGYSAAVTSDGRLFAWGSNQSCLLGNGLKPGSGDEPTGRNPKPVLVKGVAGVKQVSLGSGSVAVLLANGGLMTWGFDGYGQLGQGKSGDYTMRPKKVNVSGVSSVFAAGYRTFLLKKDGSVWWAGMNTGARRGPMSKNVKVFTKLAIE